MDALNVPEFLTALPSTFTFIEERPSTGKPAQHASNLRRVQEPSTEPGLRYMTRQQWEALKPVIQQVYIDENKPFPYLAKIFRQDYGFEPTKRQFARKIAEWGFRKNVSRLERQKIFQALLNTVEANDLTLKDRRLKPERLRNWKNRYRLGNTHAEPVPSKVAQSQVGADSKTLSRSEEQINAGLDSEVTTCACSLLDILGEIAVLFCTNRSTCQTGHLRVPEKLSCLLNTVEIDTTNSVPLVSPQPLDSKQMLYLSPEEIRDISCADREALKTHASSHYHCFQQLDLVVPFHRLYSPLSKHSSSAEYPWPNAGSVFFGYTPSSSDEIYVFPPLRKAPNKVPIAGMNLWDSYKGQQIEIEEKLSKLRRQFSDNHPAVMTLIDDLANIYYKNGNDEKAEHLCLKLVNLRRRILGPTHPRTLEACLKATHALIGQAKYYKAQSQNLALLSVILKLFRTDHGLVTYSTSLGARIATILGQDEEAESLYTRLLQMNLSLYGPRNRETLGAMARLGEIISWSRQADGEQLLRTALDLYLDEGEAFYEESCRVMTSLSDARWYHGDFTAGELLANDALERFSATLGQNHPSILSAKTALGLNLGEMGKLEESEAIFREIIRVKSISGRTRSLALSVCTSALARVLLKRGCNEEATNLYEEIDKARLAAYGPENPYSMSMCYRLGNCYERQGRYQDALQLYLQRLDSIRNCGKDESQKIKNLEGEIAWLEYWIGKNMESYHVAEMAGGVEFHAGIGEQ